MLPLLLEEGWGEGRSYQAEEEGESISSLPR